MIEVSESKVVESLSRLLDQVIDHREIVSIRRTGKDAALIAASELTSLLETAYLLRTPANADGC